MDRYFIANRPNVDETILYRLIEGIIVGDKDHYEYCLKIIKKTMHRKKWKCTYLNNSYIYLTYQATMFEKSLELEFLLLAQVIEILYYFITTKEDNYFSDAQFSRKFRVVFMYYYGWKLPEETALVTNILRNRVAHTGSLYVIEGMRESESSDDKRLHKFCKSYFSDSQFDVAILHVAGDFCYLIKELTLRSIGIKQEDLARNGAPPWMRKQFGYTHGLTDTTRL